MADPRGGLDLSDYVSLAVTAIIAGMGGAVGFFRNSNKKRDDRLDAMEKEMKEWDKLHAEHNTELAVVKTCQQNTAERLEKIDETTHDTNAKLDKLSDALTQVLLAIKSQP